MTDKATVPAGVADAPVPKADCGDPEPEPTPQEPELDPKLSVVLGWTTSGPNGTSANASRIVLAPEAAWDRLKTRTILVTDALGTLLNVPPGNYEHTSEDVQGRWVFRLM